MSLRSLKDIRITGSITRSSDPGSTHLRMSEEDAKLLEFLIKIEQDRDGEDVNKIYYEKIIKEYEDHMDYLRNRLFLCEEIVDSASMGKPS